MQETADKSNRLKNSLPEDNLLKQENIKIHGIGLDKAGRCTHYHTQLDIAALVTYFENISVICTPHFAESFFKHTLM